MLNWTKEFTREYIVNYHMINTSSTHSIDDVFNRIHFIQYDPLNVVGSNAELVLQSRVNTFKKPDLQRALYQDRTLIDGWDKQMGIYQTKYFNHYSKVRENRALSSLKGNLKHINVDALEYQNDVLDIIQKQGPVLSSSIKFGETVSSRWGSRKPSTVTLDYLFHKGIIGVDSRKNTHKRYDLNSKLIPTYITSYPFENDEEFTTWYLLRRIESLGLFSNKSGVHSGGHLIGNKSIRTKHINKLVKLELVKEVMIEGINEILYIPAKALDYDIEVKDKISFIAPLDNLIWDRNVVSSLFDFDYRWEVYTPKDKRVFGYYVLPILQKSQFIGRIEFYKQRNEEPLRIINTFFEPQIKQTKKLEQKLNQAIKKFARYLNTTYQPQ